MVSDYVCRQMLIFWSVVVAGRGEDFGQLAGIERHVLLHREHDNLFCIPVYLLTAF